MPRHGTRRTGLKSSASLLPSLAREGRRRSAPADGNASSSRDGGGNDDDDNNQKKKKGCKNEKQLIKQTGKKKRQKKVCGDAFTMIPTSYTNAATLVQNVQSKSINKAGKSGL